MTTVVNTPASSGDNNSNAGLFIGIFILVILGLLFFYFGIPALRRIGSGQITTPQIVVPDQVDVNIKQTD